MTFSQLERLFTHAQRRDDCWIWQGAPTRYGYGRLWWGGKKRLAHRVAYAVINNDEPPTLHHTCATRLCINPRHLISVEQGEHIRRFHTRAHCLRGHELSGPNVYTHPKTGNRQCLVCRRLRREGYRARGLHHH